MAKANVTWTSGMQFVAESDSNHAIVLDGAPAVGGHDSGVKPIELLLVGLAGCTGMDVISILKKKRQDVVNFSVNVEAERADEHPKVYTKIHVTYTFEGRNIKPGAVERAIELSEKTYCSAYATLQKTAKITNEYHIVDFEKDK